MEISFKNLNLFITNDIENDTREIIIIYQRIYIYSFTFSINSDKF